MSGWPDLNWRPPGPKPGAIPSYATPRIFSGPTENRTPNFAVTGRHYSRLTTGPILADVTGVEPAPNCVTGRHLNRLTSHPYFCLSGRVRTYGLRVPNSPLYQTELHLVFENSFTLFSKEYVSVQLYFVRSMRESNSRLLIDSEEG